MSAHTPPITSTQNPRVKYWARLRDRKARTETGLMAVEGYHELTLAWNAGLVPRTLIVCPEMVRPEEGSLRQAMEARDVEVVEVSRAVMERIAYRENPDAWLGIAPIPRTTLEDLGARLDRVGIKAPLLVLAENLEKPGNLGALLRSADAAGVHGVIVCQGRTDMGNPNVVRSGKGSLFALPVVECGNEEALAWLSARGIPVLAATPAGIRAHWDADLAGPACIAVGAEKEGLSDFWLTRAREQVVIPMQGQVNSLNVAQAATILLYEAVRQRQSLRP